MDFSSLGDFSLTGSLEKLWIPTDENEREMIAGGPPSDPSVSPVSSSGSEGRPAVVEILPPYPQGDETLKSLFSDDFPSLDVMLGNEFLESDNQVHFSYKQQFLPHSDTPVKDTDLKVDSGVSDAMKNRRNAIAAKRNRERKKAQFNALEKEVEELKAENSSYKKRCVALERGILTLNKELEYYKAVLANESTLSTLLQNIPNVGGINLTSSLGKRPSGTEPEKPAKIIKPSNNGQLGLKPTTGGVCLHVAKNNVSLEFCSSCSSQAALTASSASSASMPFSSTKNIDNEQES